MRARATGGITQHVSVFQTKLAVSGHAVTFMDTPGHAAFATIRERGTSMTDIACLIVAADDGVQDQTKEAIDYIRKKKVPFIVVVTKIDKPGADAEAVYMQLLQEEVQVGVAVTVARVVDMWRAVAKVWRRRSIGGNQRQDEEEFGPAGRRDFDAAGLGGSARRREQQTVGSHHCGDGSEPPLGNWLCVSFAVHVCLR